MACGHTPPREDCAECASQTYVRVRDVAGGRDDTYVPPDTDPEVTPRPSADRLPSGAALGRYLVLEVLGEGGMGVVYSAYDPQLDRKVAIKLLRGSANDGQARLLREAQAMARLSHPNVMPVYDVGTWGSTVFVAMEYVNGQTLHQWSTEALRPWGEVLEFFTAAGRGLAAAHRAGLVHRDFKPANVLLGKDGRVRVTDFGLARAISSVHDSGPMLVGDVEAAINKRVPRRTSSLESALTLAGAVMGTPDYMAPEQHDGAPTSPATDQFAFCASLYQALYGQLPFTGKTLVELGVAVKAGAVAPVPKGSVVPAWVRQVVLRGLAAKPADRFGSMDELLRALASDPGAKRWRWIRGAALVAVAVGAALGVRVYLQRQRAVCRGAEDRLAGVWDSEVKAKAAAAFTATGASYAGAAWSRVQSQLDSYAAAWVGMRTEACEATRLRGEQTEVQLALRMACLDQRLADLRSLAGVFQGADREVVNKAAAAVGTLSPLAVCADVATLSNPRKAVPAALREQVAAVRADLTQGKALMGAGKYKAARVPLEKAQAAAAALAFVPLDAEAAYLLGRLEGRDANLPRARELMQRAATGFLATGDDGPAAAALNELVKTIGYRQSKVAEGRELARYARAMVDRVGDPPLSGELAEILGDIALRNEEHAEALTRYREALALDERAFGKESLEVAKVRGSIGWVLMQESKADEARQELTGTLEAVQRLFGPDHPQLASVWNDLGALALLVGDDLEAERCFEETLRIGELAFGTDAVAILEMIGNLIVQRSTSGRQKEGWVLAQRALAILDKHPEVAPTIRAAVWDAVSTALHDLGRLDEAEVYRRKGIQVWEATLGPEHPTLAYYATSMGDLLLEHRRPAEALAWLERASKIEEKSMSPTDPAVWQTLSTRGRALTDLGRKREARVLLERAVELANHGPNPTARAHAELALAQALTEAPERARARALAERARAVFATKPYLARYREKAEAWLAAHP